MGYRKPKWVEAKEALQVSCVKHTYKDERYQPYHRGEGELSRKNFNPHLYDADNNPDWRPNNAWRWYVRKTPGYKGKAKVSVIQTNHTGSTVEHLYVAEEWQLSREDAEAAATIILANYLESRRAQSADNTRQTFRALPLSHRKGL